jgi:prefoldin beta subunit
MENVLEELKKVPDDAETYRMIGSVLVKKPKAEIVKEIEERKEELEIRIKALRSQEEALKSELEKLGKELQKLLMGGKGGAGGTAG